VSSQICIYVGYLASMPHILLPGITVRMSNEQVNEDLLIIMLLNVTVNLREYLQQMRSED
jgi:hypothetical protein